MNKILIILALFSLVTTEVSSAAYVQGSTDQDNTNAAEEFTEENWNRTRHAIVEGRTFGTLRRIKMAIPAIMYKMGMISTILVFLTIFVMKGLAIGVLLLILQFSSFFAKFHALKSDWGGHYGGHQGQGIHVHIHGEKGHHYYEQPIHGHSPPTAWDKADYNYKLDNYMLSNRIKELTELQNLYKQNMYS